MKRSAFLLGLCGATALVGLSAAQLSAADINVPGDQANLADAISAANDGDTIIITDSGTYTGQFIVDKSISIVAAEGQSPTLDTSGSYVIVLMGEDNDLQIGSADGGRITLTSPEHALHVETNSSGCSLTVTNVDINFASFYAIEARTVANIVLDDVHIDGNETGIYGLWVSFTAAPPEPPSFVIRDSTITNLLPTSNAILFRNWTGEGTLDIESSFINGGAYALIVDHRVSAAAEMTFSIVDSVLTTKRPDNPASPVRLRAGSYTFTAERTVFHATEAGQAFVLSDEDNIAPGSVLTLDHCDFIAGNQSAVEILGEDATATITNSVLIAGAEQAGLVRAATVTVTSRHNAITGDPVYGLMDEETIVNDSENFTIVNDIENQQPAYTDAAAYDFRYTSPFPLTVASEEGMPVGSNYDFINKVEGEQPDPPMEATNWELYQ